MNGRLLGLLMAVQHRHPIFSISELERAAHSRAAIEQLYRRLIPPGGWWPPYDTEMSRLLDWAGEAEAAAESERQARCSVDAQLYRREHPDEFGSVLLSMDDRRR